MHHCSFQGDESTCTYVSTSVVIKMYCCVPIITFVWSTLAISLGDMYSISTIMSDFWEYRGDNSWNNKIHVTYNDYSCPLIDTDGITPWFKCYQRNRYIGPYGRSGKAIGGFLGHMAGAGRQLPEIDIEIRYIVQVYAKVIAFGVIPWYIEQATQHCFSIRKCTKCGKSTKKETACHFVVKLEETKLGFLTHWI